MSAAAESVRAEAGAPLQADRDLEAQLNVRPPCHRRRELRPETARGPLVAGAVVGEGDAEAAMFNARIETADTSGGVRLDACLIPADGLFEWTKLLEDGALAVTTRGESRIRRGLFRSLSRGRTGLRTFISFHGHI